MHWEEDSEDIQSIFDVPWIPDPSRMCMLIDLCYLECKTTSRYRKTLELTIIYNDIHTMPDNRTDCISICLHPTDQSIWNENQIKWTFLFRCDTSLVDFGTTTSTSFTQSKQSIAAIATTTS